MPFTRDPVSLWWDKAAVRALEAARKARGEWAPIPIPDPTPGQRQSILARYGIDVLSADNRPGRAARTRWARAYVRAIYYHNRGGAPVVVQVGQPIRFVGGRRGRAVRIRTRAGGDAAMRAVKAKPDSQRIYGNDGSPAGRWSDPATLDW